MQLYREGIGRGLAMNYSEYLKLLREKKKICVYGAGILGSAFAGRLCVLGTENMFCV